MANLWLQAYHPMIFLRQGKQEKRHTRASGCPVVSERQKFLKEKRNGMPACAGMTPLKSDRLQKPWGDKGYKLAVGSK